MYLIQFPGKKSFAFKRIHLNQNKKNSTIKSQRRPFQRYKDMHQAIRLLELNKSQLKIEEEREKLAKKIQRNARRKANTPASTHSIQKVVQNTSAIPYLFRSKRLTVTFKYRSANSSKMKLNQYQNLINRTTHLDFSNCISPRYTPRPSTRN